MKIALRNLAVMMILIFNSNVTVLAVGPNAEVQKNDSLSKIEGQREKIEMKIEEFDNEIQQNMAKTEENKDKISKTEKAIESAAVEINQFEKEAEKEQKVFNSRMRTMYINGFNGYASIILDSESFGDFVSRVENIKTVIEYDKKVMDEFEDTRKELNEKQQNLNKTKKVLLSLQVENKQKLNKMIATKESQNKLLAERNIKEKLLPVGTSNPQILATKNITKANEASPKFTPSRGAVTPSSNAVIAYASNFLGTPYLWGGSSPAGFDCSGFTQYVYAHFGVSIGRTTFDQIKNGVQVSRNSLQSGDLVLFGSVGNPHHVGIYVGNNTYIHAPSTGDVVKVSAMTRSDFISARRVK
ncbi:NlpC/P60 family protein [Clostridium estertheticum]|uniref:C40 family peptidase n=1 Tax=Clostridium estertheticum TaxID=238834 RepID=UPI0013EEB6D6|nr:C40 family peptidase [Clostridium estertheticum]MBZ9609439.1 NlpC/P60 family protein [Clostridium estertheticum]